MTPLLTGRTVERVAHVDAHEGPVWLDGALYFTTVPRPGRVSPRAAIKRLSLDDHEITAVNADVVMPNGMAADRDGMLIVCDQGGPAVPAQLRRGETRPRDPSTLIDNWHGLPLNSPNDVVVKSDGTIWFTDPAYGHLQGFRPAPRVGDFVYRFHPATGSLDVVADAFNKPNGIAFAPDESVLYVTDKWRQSGTQFLLRRPAASCARIRRDRRAASRQRATVYGRDAGVPGRH